ncbi:MULTISPECIES: hypothetical protein, partial [unclassified Pseudomonas]|uniref:hypothetical protein n=1 Tax=unclassified Pseudomonas TaxID=196821 RepID=UPI001C49BFF6
FSKRARTSAHIVWGSLNEISAILPKTLKGMAVRAKPPAAVTAETDMYPVNKNLVGYQAAKTKMKSQYPFDPKST